MQTEMVKAALIRGYACEAVGEVVRNVMNADVPAGGSMFLIGLFSDTELLLGVPVVEILQDINVTDTVSAAILDREGPGGTILAAVEAYVDADWGRAKSELGRLEVDLSALFQIYMDAITWASERMAFHTMDD